MIEFFNYLKKAIIIVMCVFTPKASVNNTFPTDEMRFASDIVADDFLKENINSPVFVQEFGKQKIASGGGAGNQTKTDPEVLIKDYLKKMEEISLAMLMKIGESEIECTNKQFRKGGLYHQTLLIYCQNVNKFCQLIKDNISPEGSVSSAQEFKTEIETQSENIKRYTGNLLKVLDNSSPPELKNFFIDNAKSIRSAAALTRAKVNRLRES